MHLHTAESEISDAKKTERRFALANPLAEFATGENIDQLFGIKRTTRFKLLREGKIKGKKIGASLLIDVQSVRDFLATAPDAKGAA